MPEPVTGISATAVSIVFFAIAALLAIGIFVGRRSHTRSSRDGESRTAMTQRRYFAESVVERLKQINSDERWRDTRYTELEAEVEAEGGRRGTGRLGFLVRRRGGLRRERSLGRALMGSSESRILLQGDPGSGKSVALRHVALQLADRAVASSRSPEPIGLYVSLKDLRPAGAQITAEDIRSHVLRSHQERYLRENFDTDAGSGLWTFLFDSFDEIPEIMAAVEVDETVRRYEDAISAFLNSVRPCTGIVAAREYRGPRHLRWPRFRLLELTDRRRTELIDRSGIDVHAHQLIDTELPNAPSSIHSLSANPMFLGLLCEFVERVRRFPTTTHEVFESYVDQCLDDDQPDRLLGLPHREIRQVAQEIAFCMAADPGLGLSTELEPLIDSMLGHGFDPSDGRLKPAVEALRRVRLARAERTSTRLSGPPFSFAHRRFQEYFATCLVLAEPHRVPPAALLLNGRWRETAVTLLQLQSPEDAAALVAEAEAVLGRVETTCSGSMPDAAEATAPAAADIADRWVWPPRALHVLSILDAGLVIRTADDYRELRSTVGRILTEASRRGLLVDKKWVLDVIGPAPDDVLAAVLHTAFKSGSGWLSDAAFRQIGRVKSIPPAIYRDVLRGLLTASFNGRLRRYSRAITAQLERVEDPSLLAAKNVLRWVAVVDLVIHVALGVLPACGVALMLWVEVPIALDAAVPLLLLLPISTVSTLLFCYYRGATQFTWITQSHMWLPGYRRLRSSAPGLAVLVIPFRLYMAFVVATAIAGILPSLLVLYVLLWMLSWPLAVLLAIRAGRIGSPWVWLLPQLVAVRAIASKLLKGVAWRESLVRLCVMVGLVAVVLGLFYLNLIDMRMVEAILVRILSLLGPVFIVIMAPAVLVVVLLTSAAIADKIKDLHCRKRVRRLSLRVPESVTADEVVEIVCTYSAVPLLRSLQILREHQSLVRRADAIDVLTDLLVIREALLATSDREKGMPVPVFPSMLVAHSKWGKRQFAWPRLQSAALAEWVTGRGWRAEVRLRGMEPEIWDEIAMALDSRDDAPLARSS